MNEKQLPIYDQREKILQTLADHQVIVVESPTGSGKTTQIPQILYGAGYSKNGMIGVTQPRRIAAVSVSQFIAHQINSVIPDTVGYKMRFEDVTDHRTRIKIMTDGTLLQELKTDYDLTAYSIIMVDEAHERSLNIDFILGLLKKILERRPNFKVVISSATINAEIFSEYFEECPIIKFEAFNYPVQTKYEPVQPENDHEALMAKIALIVQRLYKERKSGDILIFLPGEAAIKNCIGLLKKVPMHNKLELLPLYSRLSYQEQERVFERYPGKTKVIVATNIAETSVTIDGIEWIIDSGLVKMNFYNPQTFTSSLIETPVSKASANQRKGRAGRTKAGNCIRLYTRKDYELRPLYTRAEIHRTDLSEVVLRMTELGIKDYENFDFISPPGKNEILSAIESLKLLDAIDEDRNLTGIGKMMIEFPILPKHSRMLVEAIYTYPDVLEETVIAASFLSANSPYLLPQGMELEARRAHHTFSDYQGDFVSYLKLFRTFTLSKDQEDFCKTHYLDVKTMREIVNIKLQLEGIVNELGIPVRGGGNVTQYLCSVARGLIQFVCVRQQKSMYRSLTAEKILIHPGSVMYHSSPRYIVAGEIVRTSRMYARSVSPLKKEWLSLILPGILPALHGRSDIRSKRPKRNYTNKIKIGDETFSILHQKGKKKIVILPWEKLKRVIDVLNPALLSNLGELRGKIVYKNHELLNGARLTTILNVASKLDLDKGIVERWPQIISLKDTHNVNMLFTTIDKLLLPCKRKKKTTQIGFLGLSTIAQDRYRFYCATNFNNAVSETLAALEQLADESDLLKNHLQDQRRLKKLNATYRRIQEYI